MGSGPEALLPGNESTKDQVYFQPRLAATSAALSAAQCAKATFAWISGRTGNTPLGLKRTR